MNREHDDKRRVQQFPPSPKPQAPRNEQLRWEELRRTGRDVPAKGGMTRYNCHQTGHHKSQCPNPSFCYSCKLYGHIAPKCPNAKINKGLKLCGFEMPGHLFYSLNIPGEPAEEDKAIRAIVTITEGRGTRFRIDTELKFLVDTEWN